MLILASGAVLLTGTAVSAVAANVSRIPTSPVQCSPFGEDAAASSDPDRGTESPAQALAAEESRVGPVSPELLPLLRRMAEDRFRSGKLDEAAALQRRALKIAIGAEGAGAPDAAMAMIALAQTEIVRRDYLDAEPLLIAAHLVFADQRERGQPELAQVLAGLSRVALSRGDDEAAVAFARQAVALAADEPAAEPWRALAAALAMQRHFAEGEQALDRALARDRAAAGPDSLPTARSLSQLGNLYLRQQRFAEALPLIEEAAQIDQQQLAPTHPLIADDLFDLGLVYDGLKRRRDAVTALRAALHRLRCGEARHSVRVAYTDQELARLYREQGDTAAADAASAEARSILNAAEQAERKRERRA
ncbi:MAG: tetratricopeptide repeat protein [Alphaproteobacteria bacterium]|nr:tetratricopeptide repeat protein [Alphaproteobacteria bacterium]